MLQEEELFQLALSNSEPKTILQEDLKLKIFQQFILTTSKNDNE